MMRRSITVRRYLSIMLLGFLVPYALFGLLLFFSSGTAQGWYAEFVADTDEAEQDGREALDRAMAAARAGYTEHGHMPRVLAGDESLAGCGLTLAELEGEHYHIANAIVPLEGGWFELIAIPMAYEYPVLRLRFLPDGSEGVLIVEPRVAPD